MIIVIIGVLYCFGVFKVFYGFLMRVLRRVSGGIGVMGLCYELVIW